MKYLQSIEYTDYPLTVSIHDIHRNSHLKVFRKFESHILHNKIRKRLDTALRNKLYRVCDKLDRLNEI